MEFAFRIDRHVKANLYKICRLCGIENQEMIKILKSNENEEEDFDEPELSSKIFICLGIEVSAKDKMPQSCCSLCSDKIDDFWEFREMCYATNAQTRKLLGLREQKTKSETKSKSDTKVSLVEDAFSSPQSPDPPSPPMSMRKRRTAVVDSDELVVPTKLAKKDGPKSFKEKDTDTTLALPSAKSSKDVKVILKDMKGAKSSSKDSIRKNKDSTKFKSKDKKKIRELKQNRFVESRTPSPTPIKRVTRRDAEINKFKTLESDPVPGTSERSTKSKENEIKEEIKEEPDERVLPEQNEVNIVKKPLPPKKLGHKCKICSESFLSAILLTAHCREKHFPSIWRYHCYYCYEPLHKNADIKNHNLWHRLSKTPFQCASCREEFSTAYNLSKHSKECSPFIPITDPRKVLPDSTCLDCKHIFLTPFLFNIHECILKKKTCPGCQLNIPQLDKFLIHMAICDNTTKYLPNDSVLNTSIKQETSQSTPMVVLETNQCVAIPAAQVPRGKRSNNSIKSTLQRVSELLDSTFSQLESIKQEPSVNQQVENEAMSEDDYYQENFTLDDHFGDTSSHEEDEATEDIDIKPDIIEHTSIDPVPLPILKLKIKMEHGKLNSSIVDSPDSPSRVQSPVKHLSPRKVSSPVEATEKRKSKKSKKRRLISDEDASISMPVPGIIRIKKEKIDSGYEEKEKGLKVSIVQSGLSDCVFEDEPKRDDDLSADNGKMVETQIKLEQSEVNMEYTEESQTSSLTLKISSVQSGVIIKKEKIDDSYEEEYNLDLPIPITIKEEPEKDLSMSDEVKQEQDNEYIEESEKNDEENYIKTIDFSNIVIKQEKELEINDIYEDVDKDDVAIVNIDVGESNNIPNEEIDSHEKCLILEPQTLEWGDDETNEISNSNEQNHDIPEMLNDDSSENKIEPINDSEAESNESLQVKQKSEDELSSGHLTVSNPQSISSDNFFKDNENSVPAVLSISHATSISPEEFRFDKHLKVGETSNYNHQIIKESCDKNLNEEIYQENEKINKNIESQNFQQTDIFGEHNENRNTADITDNRNKDSEIEHPNLIEDCDNNIVDDYQVDESSDESSESESLTQEIENRIDNANEVNIYSNQLSTKHINIAESNNTDQIMAGEEASESKKLDQGNNNKSVQIAHIKENTSEDEYSPGKSLHISSSNQANLNLYEHELERFTDKVSPLQDEISGVGLDSPFPVDEETQDNRHCININTNLKHSNSADAETMENKLENQSEESIDRKDNSSASNKIYCEIPSTSTHHKTMRIYNDDQISEDNKTKEMSQISVLNRLECGRDQDFFKPEKQKVSISKDKSRSTSFEMQDNEHKICERNTNKIVSCTESTSVTTFSDRQIDEKGNSSLLFPQEILVNDSDNFNSTEAQFEQIEPFDYSTSHKLTEQPASCSSQNNHQQYLGEKDCNNTQTSPSVIEPFSSREYNSQRNGEITNELEISASLESVNDLISPIESTYQSNIPDDLSVSSVLEEQINSSSNTVHHSAIEMAENQLNETIEENQFNENNILVMDNTNEIAENHNNENLEKELLGVDVT